MNTSPGIYHGDAAHREGGRVFLVGDAPDAVRHYRHARTGARVFAEIRRVGVGKLQDLRVRQRNSGHKESRRANPGDYPTELRCVVAVHSSILSRLAGGWRGLSDTDN